MVHKTDFVENISWYLDSKKIQNALVILVAAGLLAAGAYYGYSIISHQRQEDAQALFATLYKEYSKAATADDSSQLEHVAAQFSDGYNQAHKSMLAPYFLAYGAHAYAQAGNTKQALDMLSRAVANIPVSSPYYYLFATELAVMKLDQAQSQDKADAVAALQSLVDTRENIYSDMGLYYLLAYYTSVQDTLKVRDLQKRISGFNSSHGQDSSPWAQQASALA